MASPSVARRTTRSTVESDDVVMMRAAELAEWARKNARAIMIATAVVLAAVGAALYYQLYKSGRAERAATAYLQVQSGLPADTTQAIRQLQTFTTQYPGTTEADEARIEIAQLYLQKGDAARALEAIRPAADGGTPVAEPARFVQAAALAASGKRDEAINEYLDLARDADLEFMKHNALNQAAMLREQANNWNGAAELYRQMLDGLEKGTGERQLVELHLAEAQARAATAAAPRR
ncbi:MAG TPA: tetratricopeptide repeat protein [Longimicrobium sp.]|nr:tetratricopeptide repeat protein [Longimicrobium sp.]